MRKFTAGLGLLLVVATPKVAFALKAEDTMADWSRASETEHSELLDALQARTHTRVAVSRQTLLACMNHLADSGAHADLPIGDIAKACSQPVANDDQLGI